MRIVTGGLLAFLALTVGLASAADGQAERTLEIVKVEGIIDGPVSTSIAGAIDVAERGNGIVVLQIDSPGAVDERNLNRLLRRIEEATVPVITWIGPPGASAEHGAGMVALAGHVLAMAPGASLGPIETIDLRAASIDASVLQVLARSLAFREVDLDEIERVEGTAVGADEAQAAGVAAVVEPSLEDLLEALDGREILLQARRHVLKTLPEQLTIRFRNLGLWGRMLHAMASAPIVYLVLLVGLVGVVFEIFHPSTGPAGFAGLVGIALAVYGHRVLAGDWLGLALIGAGVVLFCVDLRFQSLGVFTVAGLGALIAGSMLLFRGPWIQLHGGVIALGVVGMTAFLLGAMTRVLRDLRAIAAGELEVREAHPHPEDTPDDDG